LTLQDYEKKYPLRQLPQGAEVTRIAPSPTGRPHIGTAMQAIVDRAIASQNGGIFILRIEDTDQTRLVQGAVEEIVNALDWLGTRPDEGPGFGGEYGPYTQSERLNLYRAAADWLVEHGHAYHCFCSVERLDEVRQLQTARGEKPMYDRHCAQLSGEEVASRLGRGEPSVIRMRIPLNQEIGFSDVVRGTISFNSNEIDESVLLKSDGFPTYHLAVVVDDHFMRITTIVRGEEWISSTPKHVLLYKYFGWSAPRFLHTPLLRDSEKRKLSKRSGDTSVAFFASQGILPGGFRNFLTRIIWPHPEGKDIYDFGEFIQRFNPSELPKTGPVVDYALLTFINGHYVWQLDRQEFYRMVVALLDELIAAGEGFRDLLVDEDDADFVSHDELVSFRSSFQADPDKSVRILTAGGERYRRLTDVFVQSRFYYADFFSPPSAEKLVEVAGNPALAAEFFAGYRENFRTSPDFNWDAFIRSEAKRVGVKAGKLFMLLRIAASGSDKTPPLHDILAILGSQEVDRRLGLAADAISSMTGK
jgi:glutamyl-tRNA synthetase